MSPATGRPRKRGAQLPAHIEVSKLPKGIYWDAANRRWYVKDPRPGGGSSTKRVGNADTPLSELHAIAEARRGIDTQSLRGICRLFASSAAFRELATTTQADYTYCAGVLCEYRLRNGAAVGDLVAARITRPLVQRLIDAIAAGTPDKPTPSKAAHVRRYLSRVWEWASNRGHLGAVPPPNPAAGIDNPRERKQRRLPGPTVMAAVIAFAREAGARGHAEAGKSPPYLWAVLELAYLCRLRGIEVVTLREDAATADGLRTNRRKGSRDNIVAWTPRLRAVWNAMITMRDEIWTQRRQPIPAHASLRPLIVNKTGGALGKSALDTAWQRLITRAIAQQIITPEQRFGPHDLKRQGITDTRGTRADKQQASGHKSEGQLDIYDHEVPVVRTPGVE